MSKFDSEPTPDEVNMVPPMDFDPVDSEPWVRYRLSDGTVIKVKHSVIMIKRLPKKNPDGTFNYAIRGNVIARAVETVLNLKR